MGNDLGRTLPKGRKDNETIEDVHARFADWPTSASAGQSAKECQLLLLQRGQIVDEVPDALLHDFFVLLVVIPEDWAPGGHIRRAVRGRPWSKFKDSAHVI